MWEALGTVRDLGRLQDIAAVLIRYGFGDVVRRIGMADMLERAGRLLHWNNAEEMLRMSAATRIRRALQELGPTFVKFGQVLATRVDLLPPDWIDELCELQDAVPALPFEEIAPHLQAALGAPAEQVFARLQQTPLASASLAQTHRAWLIDGTAVVLKIRRPGIGEVIEADLRLLARLAEIVEARASDLKRYHPCEVVRQFSLTLRRELDFAAECRSAERIADNFIGHEELMLIPAVHWQWTSEALNVQDFVDGIPGRDLAALDAAGLDRSKLARIGAGIVLKMVLEDGCFHADPHPGNIFYLRDGRIGLIDFGMVGWISEQRRYQVAQLLHGMVEHDAEAVTDVLLEWGGGIDVEESRLQYDVGMFVDQYRGVPLKDLRIGTMLSDVTTILRNHALTLPSDLVLMIKVFLTLDGVGRQLDPDFDMASEARPYLQRALLQRYAPLEMLRRGRRTLVGTMDLIGQLPRDFKRLLQAARRGRLQLHVETQALKGFGEQVNRAANRLTMGIVTAALVIGSSIVMHSVGGLSSRWLLAMGVIGFIGAGMSGIWILYSIWRSNRP
jgi:ubiquinone biosynthesis protein